MLVCTSTAAFPLRGANYTVGPEPRHTPLGGLKRLGTVMSRRKSIVQPPGGGLSSPEKKFRPPFFRKGDSSRSFHQVDNDSPSAGYGLSPFTSREDPRTSTRDLTATELPSESRVGPITTNGAVRPDPASGSNLQASGEETVKPAPDAIQVEVAPAMCSAQLILHSYLKLTQMDILPHRKALMKYLGSKWRLQRKHPVIVAILLLTILLEGRSPVSISPSATSQFRKMKAKQNRL